MKMDFLAAIAKVAQVFSQVSPNLFIHAATNRIPTRRQRSLPGVRLLNARNCTN